MALGYRENVNLAQIRTFTDMESHEEKVYKAMRETQEKEAKQKMLERAEEIRRAKIADKQMHKSGAYSGSSSSGGLGSAASSTHSGGFGSSNYTSAATSYSSSDVDSAHHNPPSFSSASQQPNKAGGSSSSGSGSRAMKLGTNKDAVPAFIEQQARTAMPSSVASPVSAAAAAAANQIQGNLPPANQERVHLKVDEKINLTCGKDGGVQNLEVLGVLSVRVTSEDDGKIKIGLRNGDARNLQLQVGSELPCSFSFFSSFFECEITIISEAPMHSAVKVKKKSFLSILYANPIQV